MAEEFAALGIPMAERGARTDEYLRAMLELWTSESTRFEGRFVRFGDLTFEPRCVQRPHAPIFVGGAGGRAFRRIADLGVGWGPMNATAADVRRGKERLDELCRVTGRSWNGRIFTRVDVEGGNDVIRTSHRSHDADDRVEEARDAIDMRTLLDDYGGLA
jgi:alkanesulfonate monooxygenase SsuD/methylene tetrahydromethanopterin reductase-like flavin-dependent oxidoreductase (luciferase family)